jgi:vacuolar-type H+-ATPase subunit E/Vma4
MSVEFLVKLRDATQMIADAANEQLEKMTPSEVRYGENDFDSLKWETKSGTKGEYQQTTKEANDNNEVFQALKQILQDHKSFWQNSSYKYWFHQNNPDIIDRRKK